MADGMRERETDMQYITNPHSDKQVVSDGKAGKARVRQIFAGVSKWRW